VGDRVTLDQVAPLPIDQSFKRYQIEFSIWRDQQVSGTPCQAENRLQDPVAEEACALLEVATLRIAEGLPEAINGLIDLLHSAQVFPSNLALTADYIGHVAGFAVCRLVIQLRIKRMIDCQLH